MATSTWLHSVNKTIKSNSPAILSGAAIAGVVGTAVLAARAQPKAEEIIDHNEIQMDPLSAQDKIKLCWKVYIPPVAVGALTIACIVAANRAGSKQTAVAVGAYTLADAAFREYKDKVHEVLGETKAKNISDAVLVDRMDQNPASKAQIVFAGGGDQLCFDSLTGRYFQSDIEEIRKAQNDLNARVLEDMYASQNDFYFLLGLEPTVLGDHLGWSVDHLMELEFTSHLSDKQTPALAIGYRRLPKADFDKF